MSRPMACTMEQESRITFTALIIVGTQACQHFDSGILVVFTLSIGKIGRQFEQRGSYYGSRRSITRSIGYARSTEIPIRHFVFGQAFQIDIGYFLHKVKVFWVFRFTIDYGVAINSPRLSTCPHCAVRISLVSHSFNQVTCDSIIYRYMIRGIVRTKLTFHGLVGMRYSDVV